MIIVNQGSGWNSKVNFVDENNVVLGYDTDRQCCEEANWFIADRQCTKSDANTYDSPFVTECLASKLNATGVIQMPGWTFDPSFFATVNGERFDAGGCAIFRIVNGSQEKFVHIFNSHNGYYSHGFKFTAGDSTKQEGSL